MVNSDIKVSKDEMRVLPNIIAVDFDGTLVTDEFPKIGVKKCNEFAKVRQYKAEGWKVILWTCRDGKALFDAVRFCNAEGLVFDAVNENIQEVKEMFNNDTRKVFANIYLDDKAQQPDHNLLWRDGM